MHVVKRNGTVVPVRYDEITDRISSLASFHPPLHRIDAAKVAHNVISKLVSGIHTNELDRIASIDSISLLHEDPQYSQLAGRLVVGDIHKRVSMQFGTDDPVTILSYLHSEGQISDKIMEIASKHQEFINGFYNKNRDFLFDYFGISTLVNGGYLKSSQFKPIDESLSKAYGVIETPQLMFLRVSLEIHGDDIHRVKETYDSMSLKECIHATPTLFHAGSNHPQLASCFLLQVDDSMDDMYKLVYKCAMISKHGGGIGIALHKLRSRGAVINTSRGISTGMIPYLRVLDAVARHVDQGGKRPGAFAVYLEPWHADVVSFVRARHPLTLAEERAPHLNYALWTNDLFMKRVRDNGTWSLFCPGEHPELVELVGTAFEERYSLLESQSRYKSQMPAQELWTLILRTQAETGMPYMLFKDACNMKSNQQHLGTLYSSNLCAEIVQHTSSTETAVCNLASVGLPSCCVINDDGVSFDFEKLRRITQLLVRNLNKAIDNMIYSTECAKSSNLQHRPIGIGLQGYANVFAMLKIPWESEKAKVLTEQISAHMYYSALFESCRIVKDGEGDCYSSFQGSPLSKGKLQFDLWNVTPCTSESVPSETFLTNELWNSLRQDIMTFGVRNSLCIALMPTASTSNILGYNETFEPFTFNLYTRRTLSGEFAMVNTHLVTDLIEQKIWSRKVYEDIVAAGGSIQSLDYIPIELKQVYKTVRELKKTPLIDLAAIRGAYVCQSQSMNVYIEGKSSDIRLLHNCHMKAWTCGLKTSSYYTHSLPASSAANVVGTSQTTIVDDVCTSCSA